VHTCSNNLTSSHFRSGISTEMNRHYTPINFFVCLCAQTTPVKGMQSTSIQSSGAVFLRGYCATYVGMESVALTEARRTADYQTTVFDCVNNLLERCTKNQEGNEICADDKQGKARVNFLIHCVSKKLHAFNFCNNNPR